jgi:hypothetical protein
MKPTSTASKPSTLRVEKGRTVQVEFLPGRVVQLPAMEAAGVAKFVICSLKRQADGRYILVPQQWQQFVRVTDHLCQDLGLPCTQRQLRRLAKAGFIEASQVTPRGLVASLPSIIAHFYRCRLVEGQESWWTRERLDTFFNAQVSLMPEGGSEEEEEDEETPKRRKKAKSAVKSAAAGQLELFAA